VKERIMNAFKRQADLDAAAVTVVTDGGKVTLGGKVAAMLAACGCRYETRRRPLFFRVLQGTIGHGEFPSNA
jgi:hypothetical protein